MTKDSISSEERRKILYEEYQKEIIAEPYKYSVLPSYFELDSWSVKQGLLLLADIDPDGADIKWDGYKDIYGVWFEKPKVIEASLLSRNPFFHFQMFFLPVDEYIEMCKNELKNIEEDLQLAESRLIRIKMISDSGDYKDERYSIEYFIRWAQQKNIKIHWLEWALEKGLITQPKTTKKEMPQDRHRRLQQRKEELIAQGEKAFIKTIAEEENLSESRIKQLIKSK